MPNTKTTTINLWHDLYDLILINNNAQHILHESMVYFLFEIIVISHTLLLF